MSGNEQKWPAGLPELPMLAGWQCEGELGQGRFGKVYEISRERGLAGAAERAALKWIALAPDQQEIEDCPRRGMSMDDLKAKYDRRKERCLEEIRVMQALQGESTLVNYQDFEAVARQGEIGWDVLIRMELLTPIHTYIRENGMTQEMVLDVGRSVATALNLCHHTRDGAQIVHGDVKPDNCYFFRDHTFKLGDFGLSFAMKSGEGSTGGTRGYLAPECLDGADKSPLSDQYALGMTMYVLLNDMKLPEGSAAIVCPARCGEKLWKVISRALQADPDERFADVQEMLAALEAVKLTDAEKAERWNPYREETPEQPSATRTDLMQRSAMEERREGYLAGSPHQQADAPRAQVQQETAPDRAPAVSTLLEKEMSEEKQKARAKKSRTLTIVAIAAVVLLAVAAVLFWPRPDAAIYGVTAARTDSTTIISWRTEAVDGSCEVSIRRQDGDTTYHYVDGGTACYADLIPGETYWVEVISGDVTSGPVRVPNPEADKYRGSYAVDEIRLYNYTIREGENGPEDSRDKATCSSISLTDRDLSTGGKGFYLRVRYTGGGSGAALSARCLLLCGVAEETIDIELTPTGDGRTLLFTLPLNDVLMNRGEADELKCKIYTAGGEWLYTAEFPVSEK